MMKNNECVPIAVVSSAPVYSGKTKDGLDKSEYWAVLVDFAGVGVPKMFVRGGRAVECYTGDAQSLYDGKYPFVTRVEYRFPHGVLRNTFRNVCKFECKIKSRAEKLSSAVSSDVDCALSNADKIKSQIATTMRDENIK